MSDLETAGREWLLPQLDKSYKDYGEKNMMELTHFDGYAMLDAIEFGAEWKEQQLENNRLAACDRQTKEEAEREMDFVQNILLNEHRQPTYSDAIEYGMRLKEQQMMAKAINTEACLTMSVPSIIMSLPLGVEVGDKLKVIIIKDE